MTFGHLFFIPLVAMIGMLFGFVMGARAARNAGDAEKKRDAEREKARAERAARKAAAAVATEKPAAGDEKPGSAA
ncbi:MAG TPA: hypothetical protein VM261_36510 [Kofleriaceae bacterium]|nr:hypothetical protein [Kofleriaceae bacterium]